MTDINVDELFNTMLNAGSNAFGDKWKEVENYAPAEFKKISEQIVEIAKNIAKYEKDNNQGYSPETGKLLLQMQRTATESVLVAVSTLTLIAVQNGINAILKVLKDTFGGILKTIL